MSDGIYEPINDQEPEDHVIDQDRMFGEDDGGDDAMDRSYSPPERPRELDAFGTTVAEQRQGETLEQRLAQEEPDPALEVDLVDGAPLTRPEDPRAGRLVDPDAGLGEDVEPDLVGRDVGIDAGAASAEEAAVHIVDGEYLAVDEGSTR